MKKIVSIALSVLMALSFVGCSNQNKELSAPPNSGTNEADDNSSEKIDMTTIMDSIIASYYEGQNDQAYKMLQKHIFQTMIESWAEKMDDQNAEWNFDSFTTYAILNQDLEPLSDKDLYCCTFRTGKGKVAYMVVSYDENGPALSNEGVYVTPYPYDLRENIDEITEALSKVELDPSTLSAARVRRMDSDGKSSKESICITDDAGHRCLLNFDENSITLDSSGDAG